MQEAIFAGISKITETSTWANDTCPDLENKALIRARNDICAGFPEYSKYRASTEQDLRLSGISRLKQLHAEESASARYFKVFKQTNRSSTV